MTLILVQRSGALGDVILTTPVIRRLRQENKDADIWMRTGYPEVFKNNPHCTVTAENPPAHKYINLDLAYEKQPSMHVVEAYMMEAFGDTGFSDASKQQELYFNTKSSLPRGVKRRFVAVHAAHAGWRNRTFSREFWAKVVRDIHDAGFWPVLLGTPNDDIGPAFDVPGSRCLIPDIHAQASIISQCVCFVGSDSSLMHVAGATQTPIVGIFTSVKPEYRLPFRPHTPSRAVLPVGLTCLGCQERAPVPSTTEVCERGDVICVKMVRPEDVVLTMMEILY